MRASSSICSSHNITHRDLSILILTILTLLRCLSSLLTSVITCQHHHCLSTVFNVSPLPRAACVAATMLMAALSESRLRTVVCAVLASVSISVVLLCHPDKRCAPSHFLATSRVIFYHPLSSLSLLLLPLLSSHCLPLLCLLTVSSRCHTFIIHHCLLTVISFWLPVACARHISWFFLVMLYPSFVSPVVGVCLPDLSKHHCMVCQPDWGSGFSTCRGLMSP